MSKLIRMQDFENGVEISWPGGRTQYDWNFGPNELEDIAKEVGAEYVEVIPECVPPDVYFDVPHGYRDYAGALWGVQPIATFVKHWRSLL